LSAGYDPRSPDVRAAFEDARNYRREQGLDLSQIDYFE
jgi:hypothetical protein